VEFAVRGLVRTQITQSNALRAGPGLCRSWIHKKCSGVEERLQVVVDFHCRKCGDCDITSQVERKEIEIGVIEKLECVEQFCYLGNMIGAGGGAEDA